MAISIKPMRHHHVAHEFTSLYSKVLKNSRVFSDIDPYRVLTLRASQLPFCPLAFFIERATKGLRGSMDLLGSYYTSVGTAVHEVMQTHLGRTDQFLADWHCPICGKWHRLCTQPNCCDHPSTYHELHIKNKYIVGHIDAIFIDSKGKKWILDFKTTSLAGAPKKKKDPGASYIEQIECYAWSVYKQYKIKVAGTILCFLPRDNPSKPVMYVKPLDFDTDMLRIKSRLKNYYRMHKHAIEAESKSEILELLEYGRCTNPWCEVCKSKDFNTKAKLRAGLLEAYKVAKSADRLPLLTMVEKQIKRNEKRKRQKERA